jgi:hypothetical protein
MQEKYKTFCDFAKPLLIQLRVAVVSAGRMPLKKRQKIENKQ